MLVVEGEIKVTKQTGKKIIPQRGKAGIMKAYRMRRACCSCESLKWSVGPEISVHTVKDRQPREKVDFRTGSRKIMEIERKMVIDVNKHMSLSGITTNSFNGKKILIFPLLFCFNYEWISKSIAKYEEYICIWMKSSVKMF